MEIKTQEAEHFILENKRLYFLVTGFENCILDYWKRMGHWQACPEINNSNCKFSVYSEIKWAHKLTIITICKIFFCKINCLFVK